VEFENRNYAFSGVLVDELARCGLRHVCICPGSRSTPLTVSFARHPSIKTWLHLDERSAAFFALGMAQVLKAPVALVCTSGTAAANFLPAITEARIAGIPLLVLTSDRPPEVWDWGAPQTIHQAGMYGHHAKWSTVLEVSGVTEELLRHVRALACRAYATSLAEQPGPVHINVPFREPLVPVKLPQDFPVSWDQSKSLAAQGREHGRPWMEVSKGNSSPSPDHVHSLAAELQAAERGIIVCGPQGNGAVPAQVAELSRRLGYPILADPLSQMRAGGHDRTNLITHYDTFLRDPGITASLAPEIVLRLGDMPTSKALTQLLDSAHQARHIVVRPHGWSDPSHMAWDILRGDTESCCQALLRSLGESRGDSPWLARWRKVEAITHQIIETQLLEMEPFDSAQDRPLFEGKLFSELAHLLPEGSALFAGNSMPVRDLDAYFPSTKKAIRCLGNRGANGIDGVLSTALGASAVLGGRLALVIGDISFYHDMNGLLAAKQYGLNATIIVVNNDGGGIFSFLPQADYSDFFEVYFGTPHGLEFGPVATLYGLPYSKVSSWSQFRSAVANSLASPGTSIIEVPSDRSRNVQLHRKVSAAVLEALKQSASGGL
jgi:2-succinyl-5-enolpyruvyl-6-hydroxy-3-cyclohexene-1-carboxylate synthase